MHIWPNWKAATMHQQQAEQLIEQLEKALEGQPEPGYPLDVVLPTLTDALVRMAELADLYATIRIKEVFKQPDAEMPDEDWEGEGFRFLYTYPDLLPKSGPFSSRHNVSWEGFEEWRDSLFDSWVMRFKLVDIAEAGRRELQTRILPIVRVNDIGNALAAWADEWIAGIMPLVERLNAAAEPLQRELELEQRNQPD